MNDVQLARYLAGECSKDEEKEILSWIQASPRNKMIFKEFETIWESKSEESKTWDVDSEWAKLCKRIDRAEEAAPVNVSLVAREVKKRKAHYHSMMHWATRTAAAFLVIGFTYFLVNQYVAETEDEVASHPVMKEIITEPGQRSNLQLGDGTNVRMNADSRLEIPNEFIGNTRTVYLSGEAYFEVASEDRPFFVITENTVIEILGTEFNVHAYEDEQSAVTVAGGIVSVSSTDNAAESEKILRKGDMAINVDGRIEVQGNVNLENKLAWLDHRLVFDNTTMDQVARRLERWYKVTIELDSELKEKRLTAVFENEPVNEVLRVLRHSLEIDYSIEGRMITFYPVNTEQN